MFKLLGKPPNLSVERASQSRLNALGEGGPLRKPLRIATECALSAAAGFCAYVLPVVLDPGAHHYHAAFLPFVRDAVEGMKPYSLGLLFGVGFIFGRFGRAPVLLTGPATMAAFPAWSILDMAMGNDHNLFPIEWFIYGVVSLSGLVGALAGRLLRSWQGAE